MKGYEGGPIRYAADAAAKCFGEGAGEPVPCMKHP